MKDMCEPMHGHLYSIMRVVVGLLFLLIGIGKFQKGMVATIWPFGVVAVIEVLVGVLLILGLWVNKGALLGAIAMFVAFFVYHTFGLMGDAGVVFNINPMTNGGERALLYLFLFLMFHMYGAGKLSMDAKMGKSPKVEESPPAEENPEA